MHKQALSLKVLISLVVGNMIGMGIYVLPASLAEYGAMSLLAWLFTSIGAMLLAFTFANLNKRFPKTGGPYVYCKEAFGNQVGFFIAYIYWLSNMIAISGIAVSLVGYLGFILPYLNANHHSYQPYLTLTAEIGIVWFFTLVNIGGIRAAGMVQVILTILKVIPLLLIIAIGLTHMHMTHLIHLVKTANHDVSTLNHAAMLTFWAFMGLESATVPAENTRGSRDIYRATIYGTLISAIICILCSFVLMGMMPIMQLKNSQFPFAQAGSIIFGSYSALIIVICAIISGCGSLNVSILIQSQVVYAAARDRLFPSFFATLTSNKVPIVSQLVSSSIITVFLILTMEETILKQFNHIALFAVSLTLTTYFVTTLAELKFVLRERRMQPSFFLNPAALIALLAAFYAMWMLTNMSKNIYTYGLIVLIAAIPIYLITTRTRLALKQSD